MGRSGRRHPPEKLQQFSYKTQYFLCGVELVTTKCEAVHLMGIFDEECGNNISIGQDVRYMVHSQYLWHHSLSTAFQSLRVTCPVSAPVHTLVCCVRWLTTVYRRACRCRPPSRVHVHHNNHGWALWASQQPVTNKGRGWIAVLHGYSIRRAQGPTLPLPLPWKQHPLCVWNARACTPRPQPNACSTPACFMSARTTGRVAALERIVGVLLSCHLCLLRR